MRLRYFSMTHNFGDALNPLIFNALLPGFFDDDPAIDFFGIGSILGFDIVHKAKRRVIFSSGFAYGTKPQIDASYDVICVRGPLTAQALGLDPKLAITDGALLLKFLDLPKTEKLYDFSFIPHWESESKFYWKGFCNQAGVNYISPTDGVPEVLRQIQASRVVIAEAMHGAIVADALRVPWIAVKAYKGINEFKWEDWVASLKLPYAATRITPLFNNNRYVREICQRKLVRRLPELAYAPCVMAYEAYQSLIRIPSVMAEFEQLKKLPPQLSTDSIVNERADQLREKLELVKSRYQNSRVLAERAGDIRSHA